MQTRNPTILIAFSESNLRGEELFNFYIAVFTLPARTVGYFKLTSDSISLVGERLELHSDIFKIITSMAFRYRYTNQN